jgi:hypothetical protein
MSLTFFYSVTMSPEKLTARFVVMFAQVPETESTWLISERLEAATSVVGLSLSMKSAKKKSISNRVDAPSGKS